MVSCFKCSKVFKPGETECFYCGTPLPGAEVPKPEPPPPVEVPAPRPPARSATRGEYRLLPEVAARGGPPPGAPAGLRRAVADHPGAALVLVAALLAPLLASHAEWRRPPAEPVECQSIAEATTKQLVVRPAAAIPEVISFRGTDVAIREAWLGEIGVNQFESFFSDRIVVRGSGRYRLYFTIGAASWAPGRAVVRQNQDEPLQPEKVTVGGVELLRFAIDVPNPFPKAVSLAMTEQGTTNVARFQIH